MLQHLATIGEAADFLSRAIGQAGIREFLNAAGDRPMDNYTKYQLVLGEIRARAERAAKLPSLVDQSGKPKPGRGPALPEGAISPRAYCALLVAEAWSYVHGQYPPDSSTNAANAADVYWRLCGGGRGNSWGNNTLAAWRHHIKEARIKAPDGIKDEIRRHLEISRLSSSGIPAPEFQGCK